MRRDLPLCSFLRLLSAVTVYSFVNIFNQCMNDHCGFITDGRRRWRYELQRGWLTTLTVVGSTRFAVTIVQPRRTFNFFRTAQRASFFLSTRRSRIRKTCFGWLKIGALSARIIWFHNRANPDTELQVDWKCRTKNCRTRKCRTWKCRTWSWRTILQSWKMQDRKKDNQKEGGWKLEDHSRLYNKAKHSCTRRTKPTDHSVMLRESVRSLNEHFTQTR